MPIYEFKHNETDEIWTDSMPWKEKEAYMIEHNCRSVYLTTPTVIGTSKDIYSKSSDDFRDRMTTVKKGYPKKGPNAANMDGW